MNPLIAVALADLIRADAIKEARARIRWSHARMDDPAIRERDGRWAAAIARWTPAKDSTDTANVGCSTVGCATA